MIKKFYLALFSIVFSIFTMAQQPPTPVETGNEFDAAVGPGGRPTSPIDMYVYVLAGIAVLGAGAYAKKYKTQLK